MRIRILVNPQAGSGAARRQIPEITRYFGRAGVSYDVAETRAPGDAARLAAMARNDGVDCIAVVGGDGTLNETVQAYVSPEGQVQSGPELALIPCGTGGDFRKTFDLPNEAAAAVERITTGSARTVDLGLLRCTAFDGAPLTRAFINITSFGLGGLTDRIVNAGPKWMGGRAAFYLGAARALLVYRNAHVEIEADGVRVHEGPILNVAIANGRFFGGGMMVAPEADATDGWFDVITIGDLSRAEGLALSSKIYRGTHLTHPKIHDTRARVVTARAFNAEHEVLIDMDGETPGRLPLTAEVAHAAVRMRI